MKLKLGIIGISYKENEKRLPIYPGDFKKIDKKYQKNIFIDHNYGINFGYSDDQLQPYVGGILSKEEIYKICDVILILKYTHNDYKLINPNKICWGWHHLVQSPENVDVIIKKNLTTISIEEMYENNKYILEDNRFIAGYASVMHALQLKGLTGYLLNIQPKIAVISYGGVGKGAVDALIALNMNYINVFTKRPTENVSEKRNGVLYFNYPYQLEWAKTLKNYDIIINCILQDPLNPIIFLNRYDLLNLHKKMYIIDISCDTGMGFDFAVSTTFSNPIIQITDNVDFYGIDHSPSVFYNTVTQKISNKLINYIPHIIDNKIYNNTVLNNAIEITPTDI